MLGDGAMWRYEVGADKELSSHDDARFTFVVDSYSRSRE